MATQDMIFLAAISSGYLLFMLTLGWGSWYCRDVRGLAPQPAPRPGRTAEDA